MINLRVFMVCAFCAVGCSSQPAENCFSSIPTTLTTQQFFEMELNPTPGDDTLPFTENGFLFSDSYCDPAGAKMELAAIGYPLSAFDFEEMRILSEEEYRQSPLSYGAIDDLDLGEE